MRTWKATVPVKYVRFRGANAIDVLRTAAAWIAENGYVGVQDFVMRDTDEVDYEAMLYYIVEVAEGQAPDS